MCTAATARRRRAQAANGFKHLHKGARPLYKKRDAASAARRLQALIATERRMQQGNKKK